MNFKKIIPLTICLVMLFSVIAISSNNQKKQTINNVNRSADISSEATSDNASNTDEFRGVWISYMELSMENESDKSENAFKNKFEKIAENCSKFGLNTLIVQVRPFCDSLYKSKYFPWSHILTGTQGKNPGYDPLKIMCDISKSKNLKIHAWINPYRISTNNTPSKLADSNPYSKNSSIALKTESGIYLDPSNKDAQDIIINGVEEIIKNYDVDGIQFDDYFYPPDINDCDKNQYAKYVESAGKENSMSIDNWRTANVNVLICNTYRKIHSISKNVDFGISPQGNLNNNYKIYADVKSWCQCRGFVDYICPQIYFSLDNPRLTFEESLNEWCSLEYDKNVKLYVGLAGYKAGSDDDEGTWLDKNDILSREYDIINKNKNVDGFAIYSYASIIDSVSKEEMNNLKEKLY